jgi:branched-chain amino acid transport system permease protein
MTSQSLSPEKPKNAVSATDTLRQTWLYRFVLLPIGQQIIFIVGASLILTLIAYFFAFVLPSPVPSIVMSDYVSKQLPTWIINGVSQGYVYSMIALGYTLVYGVLKFINFAHSEIFMIGGILGYEMTERLFESGLLAQWHPIAIILAMLLVSMVFCGFLAMFIERVAYRPLRNAPRLVPLITAIGISYILQDVVRATMSISRNLFDLPYETKNLPAFGQSLKFMIGETQVSVRPTFIIVIIVAVIMLILLNYFVNGTKWGRGIRAVSQDPTMSGLVGVNVNLLISLTFFLGGAFGGAAGAMYGLNVGVVNAYSGFFPGIKAFTAAVLGGIGNLTGALLGGLTIGLLEVYLNGYLGLYPNATRYTDIIVFLVLIGILIFRPSGILGERVDEKV